MLITDWIRAAVAGNTVDGRQISETAVTEVADSYTQETYNARIWPEHIRGIAPGGLFKALGDVVQVKAERIKSGSLVGKLGLYVKLAPHEDLIALVRGGQKVHLSVELQTNFAGTGKAYLVGLGVTDSPASLGTGIMKFSTSDRQNNLFSLPQAADINLSEDSTMNPELLTQAIQTAMKPLLDRMEAQEGRYKTIEDKVDKIIELATPIAGNGKRRGDREPHNGGYSEHHRTDY